MKKNYDLGKGISALFENIKAEDLSFAGSGVHEVPLNKIVTNVNQPRKIFAEEDLVDLAASIRNHGIVQPIIVRPCDGNYEVVAGERRYRAAQLCGLEKVPVVIKDFSSEESYTVALIENLQRSDLNPIEEAEAFGAIIKTKGFTQDDLASYIGKTRSYIANSLRLLTLPESVQKMVRDGALTPGHARALIGKKNAGALAKNVVGSVEALVAQDKNSDAQDIASIENTLSTMLNLKTRVVIGKNGGKIEILFKDAAELEILLSRFCES